MTKLELLNRKMHALEKQGHLSEEHYETYKLLLDAVEILASIRLVLSDDPQVLVGNSKAHFAYHKARGAMDTLN